MGRGLGVTRSRESVRSTPVTARAGDPVFGIASTDPDPVPGATGPSTGTESGAEGVTAGLPEGAVRPGSIPRDGGSVRPGRSRTSARSVMSRFPSASATRRRPSRVAGLASAGGSADSRSPSARLGGSGDGGTGPTAAGDGFVSGRESIVGRSGTGNDGRGIAAPIGNGAGELVGGSGAARSANSGRGALNAISASRRGAAASSSRDEDREPPAEGVVSPPRALDVTSAAGFPDSTIGETWIRRICDRSEDSGRSPLTANRMVGTVLP